MPPLVFKTAFDEYRAISQVGQGGTGFVVSATDCDGKTFAIKYLNPNLDKRSARKRFQNEILFGQQIANQHVIKILDVGVVDIDGDIGGQSAPFYCIEFGIGT